MKHLPKVLLLIFFLGLLAVPFALQRAYEPDVKTADTADALRSYGFYLEDVAARSGVNFRHQSPRLDPKLENIMPIIASMGAAVSIVDYDRDGWNDIYLTNSGEGSKNALYRNQKDGTFTDVAESVGLADVNQPGTGVSMGTVWGDYDNDGFEDVFLYKWGKPELFHNDAGRGFTRVSDGSGLPEWANANTAIWLDYDRDGKIDLFVGGYFPESLNLWQVENTRIMPESFEYAKNGGRKYLFRNLGGGKFEEVSRKLGIDSNRWALAAGAADIRGTGYPDLFIANDYGVSELYLNEKGQRFVEAGEATGVGFAPKSGMNASFGDVLNQGKFSIYVSNISEPGILLQGNNLWMQKPDSGELKFENQASSFGVEFGGWSWGAQFADLNNDGNQDLFLTNGYISGDQTDNYWYDYSKITVGNNSIISDAGNWAPIGERSLAGFQAKKVWLNDGAGRFNDVAMAVGVDQTFDGRSVAVADLWNRGVLDVVVANQNGPVLVLKNNGEPTNNWIGFDLEGTVSNRSAIGAQVRVFWNGQQQVQEILGGIGFCSQNQRRLQFGIGKTTSVDKVEIRWPSGKVLVIDGPKINQVHVVKEEIK
ncbi:MAG: CRTAC1 family protein [Pyrinomonadaceae bacterium]